MVVAGWSRSRSGMRAAISGEPLGTANQSTWTWSPKNLQPSGSMGTKSGGWAGLGASSMVAMVSSLVWACIEAPTPGMARIRWWISVSEEAL